MSVLRYPGGKTRAVKVLIKYIPDDMTLISPFFGGGSLELSVDENIQVIANDKFYPLINFWKCVKTDPKKVISETKKIHPLSKDKFLEIRTELNISSSDEKNNYELAAKYYAVNRSSFSGSTCSGGYSKQAAEKRFNIASINRLNKLHLSNVEFHNCDFSEFLNKFKGFIYADPPYYLEKKSKLYGSNGDLHENFDHEKLQKILEHKEFWILCYNDCEFIRDKYKKYKIVKLNWSYGMNKSKKSSEILILSYKVEERMKNLGDN